MASSPRIELGLAATALVATLGLAFLLRAPDLRHRPMHTDEAVHAIKFGRLLEDGEYRYDPTEYHGPTLNYLTLVPARLDSATRLALVDESTLRVVPVVFGLGLVLSALLLRPALGSTATTVAMLLTAVSPALVFYSRYYIQEMLLVAFTSGLLGCGYRYLRSGRPGWAVASGVCLGLMHATKETAVLCVIAMAVALAVTFTGRRHEATAIPKRRLLRDGLVAGAVAALTSALFYSSFLSHPGGVLDSLTTYLHYFDRAQHEWHRHPWHYYLNLLLCFRVPGGPWWSEGVIPLFAGVALLAVARGKPIAHVDATFARFLATYTVSLLIVYSLIPYKTPWNVLGPLHGLVLLAGIGAAVALDRSRGRLVRIAATVVLTAGALHLVWQSWLGTRVLDASPTNPWVYAHTSPDVVRAAERVHAVAQAHPAGSELVVEVVVPGHDYWPLPWYLRDFPNVGWWGEVDTGSPPAPLVLATPEVEPALLEKLYELPPPGQKYLYVPLFESTTELRPTVELRGYVRKDLWDRFEQRSAEEGSAPALPPEPASRRGDADR